MVWMEENIHRGEGSLYTPYGTTDGSHWLPERRVLDLQKQKAECLVDGWMTTLPGRIQSLLSHVICYLEAAA